MIRVLICDDQLMVREGLKTILSNAEVGIQVVGLARDGAEALDLIPKLKPDLVLMDLKMPVMNGVQATQQIQRDHPDVRVLILTTYDADEWVFDAIRAGADGYLLKDADQESLISAIQETASGRTIVDSAVAGKLFDQIAHHTPAQDTTLASKLSPRERELASLLAKGYTNTEIAEQLFLSEGTVRNYLSNLFAKLGVADRTQAAVMVIKYGLANLDEEP